jgi:hypothetical protein
VEPQAAAERFGQRLGGPDFKASTGWPFRFRNRHGIANRKLCGESMSADNVGVQPFRENCRKIVEEGDLPLSQVYNSAEMGSFWKAVPGNTQANKQDDSVPDGKLNKERITILVCANADRSHRLTQLLLVSQLNREH